MRLLEVVKILPLVLWKEYCSMQGHCTACSRVFSVSAKGVEVTVPAVNDYRAALNYVFTFAGTDLAANKSHQRNVHYSKILVFQVRLNHQSGTCFWFERALLIYYMNL